MTFCMTFCRLLVVGTILVCGVSNAYATCGVTNPTLISGILDCLDPIIGDIDLDTEEKSVICDEYERASRTCFTFDFTVPPECELEYTNISSMVVGVQIGACIAEEIENCLDGNMIVETSFGEKQVRDLEVGDMVSIGSGRFEPIVWNTQHYQDGKRGNHLVKASFLEFELVGGYKVTITPSHYAKTSEGDVLAREVKVGQIMFTGNGQEARVVKVNRVVKQGVYNPQTPSQRIEANGVIVSTRSEGSPRVLSIIFQVLSHLQAFAPAEVYTAGIEAISRYVYEPLWFGENSKYLTGTAVALVALALKNSNK